MACGCNGICDNDCAVNRLCTGYEPACSNTYSFTSIAAGQLITAAVLAQLEAAINAERANVSRRYNSADPPVWVCNSHTPGNVACSNNSFGPYSFTGARGVGDIIYAQHYTNVKNANNLVTSLSGSGATITQNFVVGAIINATDIQALQTGINQTRNICICNAHCNCNPADCGCNNADCGSDDPGYLPNPGCLSN
jgi:hypothetical protein